MQDAVFVVVASLLWMGAATPGLAADPNQDAATSQAVQDAPSAAAPAGEIIRSIEFEGNRKFKDHVLRQRLGFELGDRLDPFLAEGGRLTISEVYRKIGFPFVAVSLDRQRMTAGHLLYRIEEGPRVQIESVEFVGNESFKSGTLKQVIKTKQKKWLVLPAYYAEETIEEDVDRLQDFYYDHGHLDYQIKAETEFTDDRDAVRVTFLIEEGPVYHIGEILFSGNARFTSAQLHEWIELRAGQGYLRPAAERDAKAIAERYREQGFVDAQVRQNPRFTPKAGDNLVTLRFEITEGRQFRIGRIDVTGNETTQDRVVRRVLDEYGFTPGELYNAKIAPKEGSGQLERHVQYFSAAQEVLIRPVNTVVGDPNRKDVRVNIEEGSTGVIMPGVGVSTDHGVVGRLVFRQRNFDIADWPEDLWDLLSMKAFRGAGQTLSLTLEPGTRYSQYYVNFVDPFWRDKPVELDVSGRSWQRFRESYDEHRLRGDLGFEQRLKARWRRSIAFRAESVEVSRLDYDAPREIRNVEGHTQLFGTRFGIGEAIVDDLYNPAQGHRFNTFYEQVGGDRGFGLLESSYVQYFTLGEDVLDRKTILSFKLLGGTVVGDAPPFEKYYAGGNGRYGMRGFEYRGISTRGLQTNVLFPEYKDPVGSDWVFLAGTEVVFPLVGENFGGLLFLDTGTVDTGSYRLSIGAGIQIVVPQVFGNIPMRFEIAVPLLKDDDDETQVFSFSQPGF